jgi:hypothetical protein
MCPRQEKALPVGFRTSPRFWLCFQSPHELAAGRDFGLPISNEVERAA